MSEEPAAPNHTELIGQVLDGNTGAYEHLVRRHNRRLYRTLRPLVGDQDAEDVMQEAYVLAFQHLRSFEGRASFTTWLTRIALHEAYRRMRDNKRFCVLDGSVRDDIAGSKLERNMFAGETRHLLEEAMQMLPE